MASHSKEQRCLLVRVPQGTGKEKMESGFEELLLTFHETLEHYKLSIELLTFRQNVYFVFVVPEHIASLVEGQIYALYPHCEIETVRDYTTNLPYPVDHLYGRELSLERSDIYPIKMYDHFEGDAFASVFSILTKSEKNEQAWIQYNFHPIEDTWQLHVKRAIKIRLRGLRNMLRLKHYVKSNTEKDFEAKQLEAINKKAKKKHFQVSIRVGFLSESALRSQAKLKSLLEGFAVYNEDDLNRWKVGPLLRGQSFLANYRSRNLNRSFSLNSMEFATLAHFPNPDVIPHIVHVLARKAEAPMDLPIKGTSPDICLFGVTNYHNQGNVFGIKPSDRARHLYIVGKSGVGKSKLQELLIREDILRGNGVGVIDPHGDLIDNVMKQVPKERIKDCVYFDPADSEWPIAFNPLEQVAPEYKMRVTIGFIEIFKKLFGSNWSNRLEHVLRYTTLALLDSPNTTVLSILKMLTDKNYRQKIVARIEDSVIKNFWVNEFAGWSEKFDSEAIMPVLNKVGQFVSTSLIRNIVGQPENKLNIRSIMDEKKIFLIKLSRGLLGDENSNLLGSMIITKMQQAAMSRADIPEDQRKEFYLYVDEFQNFATDTFEQILSEARKYRLSVTLAHQFMGQLSPGIRATVFGNVGSMISFRVGAEDANILEKEYNPIFKSRDIINLGTREFYVKMSIDGEMRDAFSGKTLGISYPEQDYTKEIIDYSHRMYCKSRSQVEKDLAAWDEAGSAKGVSTAAMPMLEEEEFGKPTV